VTAALIMALAVAVATSALAFWAIRWARENAGKAVAEAQLREMVRTMQLSLEDRDRLIATRDAELTRLKFATSAMERMAKDHRHALEELAAKNPAVMGPAIRNQLARLRRFAEGIAPDPAAATSGDPSGPG
jgi:uncharacterized protein HemX